MGRGRVSPTQVSVSSGDLCPWDSQVGGPPALCASCQGSRTRVSGGSPCALQRLRQRGGGALEEHGPRLTRQQQQVGHQLHLAFAVVTDGHQPLPRLRRGPTDGARWSRRSRLDTGLPSAAASHRARGALACRWGARYHRRCRCRRPRGRRDTAGQGRGAFPAPSCHPPPRAEGTGLRLPEPRRRGAGPGATERRRLFGAR